MKLNHSAEQALKSYMERGLISQVNPETMQPISWEQLTSAEQSTMTKQDLAEIVAWVKA